MKTTIQKKHIGHPLDFLSSDGETVINGRIEEVKNRFAVIRYWMVGGTYSGEEGFTACIPVHDKRIIEVY